MGALGLAKLGGFLKNVPLAKRQGRVVQVVGTVIEAELPGVAMGELAQIGNPAQGRQAEVIGFREHRALLMSLSSLEGIAHGSTVRVQQRQLALPVGDGILGRVVDPLGVPLDGRPLSGCPARRPLQSSAPPPMARTRITSPLPTGIRAIDGVLTLGEGQRIGIMAGSGVGKSTLLGMFARGSTADVNVVVLIGERGREVREFLERDLGPEGLARSVVVVATSDVSPVLQVKAMLSGLAVAEHFRDQGKRVLLMADSLTRLAMAQRQIGLAAGEPPTTRGYTPSVFTLMPRLLERAGMGAGRGSITAVCTVLVEADDMEDPIADMVRGIVDGHIVLSRKLASYGHYPPIDILESVSRTMPETVSEQQVSAAARLRALVATWRENEELVRLGAYKKGTDAQLDRAIDLQPAIARFLRQGVGEQTPFEDVGRLLAELSAPAAQARKPAPERRVRRRAARR